MAGQAYSEKEMIGKLVGFPTVSCDSNLALIEFVKEYKILIRITFSI